MDLQIKLPLSGPTGTERQGCAHPQASLPCFFSHTPEHSGTVPPPPPTRTLVLIVLSPFEASPVGWGEGGMQPHPDDHPRRDVCNGSTDGGGCVTQEQAEPGS